MFSAAEPLDTILRGAMLSTAAAAWIVFLVRIVGLRAFSKLTAFDFVVTIAVGSLLAGASQAETWSAFLQSVIAITALMGAQYAAERLKLRYDRVEAAVQNRPVLLMRDGKFIPQALAETRVTEADLRGKLRDANVLSLEKVRAVVLETTGSISVLHGDTLDQTLLTGVQRKT
ncbi:DUF421 domain-containing protein [Cribrihabitans neustonicus]|uniref:DUF421 domain-containing protein n=1 Tax=Cribrihabitans neustonicus TaxID=1429085 RepID=UPI003B5A8BC8